jgi:hypothetical protein
MNIYKKKNLTLVKKQHHFYIYIGGIIHLSITLDMNFKFY